MSGILGQSVPSDNTVLYKAPTDKYASTSLIAVNTNAASADTFDVAVRDYDRVVTIAASTANDGNFDGVADKILSDTVISLTTVGGDIDTDVAVGDDLTFLQSGTSTPTGITAKVAKVFEAYTVITYALDERTVDVITVSTFTAGAIEIDDQLTDAGGDNGIVKGISDPGGGADITLVLEMTAGNFTAAESLDNTTQGTNGVTTVSAVTATAAPALFDTNTNELFNGVTHGDGDLLIFDISAVTTGFDIFTDSGLTTPDELSVLRYGTLAVDGKMYFAIDTTVSDTYYFGDAAYTGNLSNTIDTTGTASWTGVNDALLIYDVKGGGVPNLNDDLSLNGNTFTVNTVDGSGISARTIGKYNTGTRALKVIEYDATLNQVVEDTLLYNSVNAEFALATAVSPIANESYIYKANSIAAATTEKISGLILGPEQSVLVNSTSGSDTSFTLLGFEEAL